MKTKVMFVIGMYLLLSAIYGGSMGFIGGIYTVRLREVCADEFMVNMVNFGYYLSIFIFEIPTGLFADTFGRKNSFVISCFLEFLSMLVYGFADSFWACVVAETIGAIGKTFATGAFRAWCVDSIKHYDPSGKYGWVFSVEHTLAKASWILTSVAGGFIGRVDLSYPFFAGAVGCLIASVIAIIFLKEVAFEKKVLSFKTGLADMVLTAKNSWQFCRDTESFRFVVFLGMILSFCIMPVNMEWQEIFKREYCDVGALGVLMGICGVVITIGSAISTLVIKKTAMVRRVLIWAQIGIGISVFLTVVFDNRVLILTFFLIHELLRGMYAPIKEAFIQDCIPSKERATLGSFYSMGEHFAGTISLFVFGLIAKHYGIHTTWIISGAILVVGTIFFSIRKRKTRESRSRG